MKKKTILFFPVEIGLAHIVRSLAVAEELHNRGHKVIFALPKSKMPIFSKSAVNFIDIAPYAEKDGSFIIKKFSNYQFLNSCVEEELKIIQRYKPDITVNDYRISALASAKIANIKTYLLSNSSGLPNGSYLPNPGLPIWLYKIMMPIVHTGFNLAFAIYLRPLLRIVREHRVKTNLSRWFHGITYILPEPAFYLPALDKSLDLHYVSPLSWKGFLTASSSWLEKILADGKTIYLSFGGTGFDKKKLIELSILLVKNNYRVVVSTGTIAEPGDFPKINNLFVDRFLPGKIVSQKVDLIVCHGGYGTTIEAVINNKPVLVIPFNPDQVVHAWRMRELKVGKCLLNLNLNDIHNIFTFNWKKIEDKGKNIDVKIVLKSVQEIFDNMPLYKQALKEFNQKYPQKDGASQAADIIEKD